LGAIHLDTMQMPTAIHSDRCLENFHFKRVAGQLNRVHLNVTQLY